MLLPPLRERREDIPLLTSHFLKEFNARHGKAVAGIAEPLRRAFDRYDWPGNVRELRNTIESAVVQDLDGTLDLNDLPESDPLRQCPASGGARQRAGTRMAASAGRCPRSSATTSNGPWSGPAATARRRPALLGIGERTLYRVIQDWKQQDRIRTALDAVRLGFRRRRGGAGHQADDAGAEGEEVGVGTSIVRAAQVLATYTAFVPEPSTFLLTGLYGSGGFVHFGAIPAAD